MDIRARESRGRSRVPFPTGRSRLRGLLLCGALHLLLAIALAAPPALGAQETRTVSGVVVDAGSGRPVASALVTIGGTGLSAVTDAQGRFEVTGVPIGSLQLVLSHVAYGEQAEALEVGTSGALDFRIRVSSRAIELEPLDVEVASADAQAQRAAGTATHVIDRATIDASPPSGQGLLPLLQSRIPSLRVQGNCVEYRFQQHAVLHDPDNPELLITVPCRDVTVYLNGMPNPQGSALLQQLSPQDVERIQILSPAEAGLQYVAGNRGVILVELREGVGRETPYRIHVNGFGWDEPQPYPWLRALGVTAVGNALVVGVASKVLLNCGEDEALPGGTRCHDMAGMTAAFLTGALAPVVTRWAGRTPHSEGRTYPALLTATAIASAGYLLYVHGEREGSDGSRTAGQVVLAVGIPVTLTFANRLFRMLR